MGLCVKLKRTKLLVGAENQVF